MEHLRPSGSRGLRDRAGFAAAVLLGHVAVPGAASSGRGFSLDLGAQALAVEAETIFVRRAEAVVAIEAPSGRIRWNRDLPDASTAGPVVTEAGIAVATGDAVELLERSTGELRWRADLGGRAHRLVGPATVAVVAASARTELWAVDDGTVTGVRPVGSDVYDIRQRDGVLLVVAGLDEELPALVVGMDPGSLADLWQAPVAGATRLYEVGPEVLVHRFTHERGREFLPIDVRSGAVGTALPERRATFGYSDLTWELQLEEQRPAVRRSSRRDGSRVWETAIPGRPDAWVVSDGILWMHAGPELVAIDWTSGEISKHVSLAEPLEELVLADGTVVARTTAGGIRGLPLIR